MRYKEKNPASKFWNGPLSEYALVSFEGKTLSTRQKEFSTALHEIFQKTFITRDIQKSGGKYFEIDPGKTIPGYSMDVHGQTITFLDDKIILDSLTSLFDNRFAWSSSLTHILIMGAITEQEKLLLQEKTHEHFNIAVLADITEFDLTHDNSSILDVRSEMQKSGIHWTNLHEAQHMIECKKLQFDAEL